MKKIYILITLIFVGLVIPTNMQAAFPVSQTTNSVTIGNEKSSPTKPEAAGDKSQLIALLLCAFVGGLGVHRFYLGYIWQGVVQLLTAGGLGIWWLIDLIRIIIGSLEPKNGPYDSTL